MITNDAMRVASQKGLRRPHYRVRFAFARVLDPTIDYLTYDNSENYDSGFLYQFASGDVLQEWDQYIYREVSVKALSLNVERELLRPSSVALAYADIVLDNSDGQFSRGGEWGDYMLPSRPVKIDMGFDNQLVPQFVGLTARRPEFDEKNKTVSFHAQDFLGLLLSRPVQETVLLENYRVDEILAVLFEAVGLLPTQYSFDQATVTVPFFYANKGDSLFNVASKLVDAEVGSLFMDEFGMVRFTNRGNFVEDMVFNFHSYWNIFDYTRRREDDLINKVQVSSKVRELQPLQKYWESPGAIPVLAGQSVVVWANFNDPVKDIDEPSIGGTYSSFTCNTAEDGSGSASTDISVTGFDEFASSAKITFTNAGSSTLFITSLVLYCKPAFIVNELYVEDEDTTSVDAYGERLLSIENDYFSEESDATSFSTRILVEYKEPALVAELDVLGTPQLQLNDVVDVSLFGVTDRQQIVRIANKIENNRFSQVLRLKDYPDLAFFNYDNSQNYDEDNIYRI